MTLRKKKILKNKSVIELEVPTKDVVPVEKSDDTEDDDDIEKDIDEDTTKCIEARRVKAKTGVVLLIKHVS